MLACYREKRKIAPAYEEPEGPGGRQVCTKGARGLREYRSRTEQMWLRQKGICSICFKPMRIEEATYEHSLGRGMGGGHRDDRIVIDGKPFNTAAHGLCNAEKGSRRVA